MIKETHETPCIMCLAICAALVGIMGAGGCETFDIEMAYKNTQEHCEQIADFRKSGKLEMGGGSTPI